MSEVAPLIDVYKRQAQNLFITGSSGTGKSYLACALGHEACKRGFRTFYALSLIHIFKEEKSKKTSTSKK